VGLEDLNCLGYPTELYLFVLSIVCVCVCVCACVYDRPFFSISMRLMLTQMIPITKVAKKYWSHMQKVWSQVVKSGASIIL
jgi:hypothetical protein